MFKRLKMLSETKFSESFSSISLKVFLLDPIKNCT